jgi:hypothetical protein
MVPGWGCQVTNDEAALSKTETIAPLKPRMTEKELDLFRNFVCHVRNYVEFGAGGSTCAAAPLVGHSIISIDSSEAWLQKVGEICAAEPTWIQPTLLFIDVGPLGAWGSPADPSTKDRWPAYHEKVWGMPGASEADLYMVDGRFRIACFMQCLLHARPGALVAIHDYTLRPDYAVVAEVADQIASVDTLAVFRKRYDQDDPRVRAILEKRRFHRT